MNPFKRMNKTITAIDINVTNIRSLSITVPGATNKKITRILDLKCAINIVIDPRIALEEANRIYLVPKVKLKLSNYKHVGTYTKKKGIIIIYNKTIVKIRYLKIIKEGQLATFQIKANNDSINFSTLYAPQDDDNPDFMLKSKMNLDSM